MVRAIIIDDVEKARAALKSDISDYCPNIQIVGEAEGVNDGIEMMSITLCDLVFLDIRMGDGTGFDLIEKWLAKGRKLPKVIFTTAYDEYAIKAFRFSAVDYLLKPIDAEELQSAVEKIESESRVDPQLQAFLNNFGSAQKTPKKLALSSTEKIQVVDVDDILRCEAHKNYTLFYISSGEQILVTKTLKEYDEMLSGELFLRVHHSQLVNLSHVTEFVKTDGGYLVLSDGTQVGVSVRKREVLLSRLANL